MAMKTAADKASISILITRVKSTKIGLEEMERNNKAYYACTLQETV